MTKESRSILTLIVVCAIIGAAFYTQKQSWFRRDDVIRGEASPSPKPARLRSLVDQNDACTLVAQKLVSSSSSDELIGVLMNGVSDDPDLVDYALSACSREPRLIAENSSDAKFFNALLLGRLIDPSAVRPDYEKAFQALSSLMQEDPKNGAFPYFRAAIRQRKGDPAEEVRQDLLLAFAAPEFDAGYLSQARKIHQLSLRSPALFLVGVELISRIRVPDYVSTLRLIEAELEKKDPAFARAASRFGERLMKPGIEARGKWEMLRWSALEYSLGRKVASDSRKGFHAKSAQELTQSDPGRSAWAEAYRQIVESASHPGVCDTSKMSELLVDELRRDQ